MNMPEAMYGDMRAVNVNEVNTTCNYVYWEGQFAGTPYLANRLCTVREHLGMEFNRNDVVGFYSREMDPVTKFLAAMVWGHEAPAGGHRDGRGPWKVSQTFSENRRDEAVNAIEAVRIQTSEEIKSSYLRLYNTLTRCGPSFFTKHLYFLGKAQGVNTYPLIFDARVANGLVRVALPLDQEDALNMIRVAPVLTPDAYHRYLDFVNTTVNAAGCEPDQVEYFLFRLGG